MPLQDVQLYSGSVISVESRLLCTLYDVGGNVGGSLKRNMYSVVRLQESYVSPPLVRSALRLPVPAEAAGARGSGCPLSSESVR